MAIIVYNTYKEDHTSNPNNYYIGRPSILSNPFTYDGRKSSLARLSFKTIDEALEAYKIYFKKMYETDILFKHEVDEIYDKYKNGETIYLQCFCDDTKCHGYIIRDELQKRLIKEKIIEKKQPS